jgi:hypothetical protein
VKNISACQWIADISAMFWTEFEKKGNLLQNVFSGRFKKMIERCRNIAFVIHVRVEKPSDSVTALRNSAPEFCLRKRMFVLNTATWWT